MRVATPTNHKHSNSQSQNKLQTQNTLISVQRIKSYSFQQKIRDYRQVNSLLDYFLSLVLYSVVMGSLC